jgi:hypothetical protein
MKSDSNQQGAPKRSRLIPVVGWSWTVFACFLIAISLLSLVIRVAQGLLPLSPDFHLAPLSSLLLTSGILFTIGSTIAIASQLMIRRNALAWNALRLINLGFIIYIIIKSVAPGQFPTFSRLHQAGTPPALTYFSVVFAIFVITIWLGLFVASLCLLNLKSVKAEFPSSTAPSA